MVLYLVVGHGELGDGLDGGLAHLALRELEQLPRLFQALEKVMK